MIYFAVCVIIGRFLLFFEATTWNKKFIINFFQSPFSLFPSFRQALNKHEPVYQAIWAETTDFDEVLISPVMLQDHMPETVLSALEKVSLL